MSEAVGPRRNRFLMAQWVTLLEDDSFRRFWFMRLASHGATNALNYALLVFTVRQWESALATGFLLLTMIVPSAMLGAIAGVSVDRLPRGLILVTCCVLRAVLVFALVGAKDSLPTIYAVSLGLGIVTQFAVPAEAAVVPSIVRNRNLVAANSFINLGTLASQVLGMLILAPVLLKTTNGDALLLMLVLLFILSAVLITVIPQFHFASTEQGRSLSLKVVRREFAESWLHLGRDSTAFLALILLVVATISTLVIATMLPKFSIEVLKLAPENIVFVLAPVSIAIFTGLRTVEFFSVRFNRLVTISAAYVVMAGALIALGFTSTVASMVDGAGPMNEQASRIAVTIVFANVYGFALTVVLTMGRVLLNERVPLRMQGRIFAAQSILSNLTAIVPIVVAGLLADAAGVQPVLILGGVAALLAAAWSQARSSRIAAPFTPQEPRMETPR